MFSYQLTDINKNQNNYQLIIMEDSSIIINYGKKKETFKLVKGNKIRWETNIIITIDNTNHYKSTVIGEVVEIKSSSNKHIIDTYIKPSISILAPGSGWEA